jgi:hypothetical protein
MEICMGRYVPLLPVLVNMHALLLPAGRRRESTTGAECARRGVWSEPSEGGAVVPSEFSDKVAFVTGAARGQDRSHVLQYADHGADVS